MRTRTSLLLITLATSAAESVSAQTASRVADINQIETSNRGSYPADFVRIGNDVYFTAASSNTRRLFHWNAGLVQQVRGVRDVREIVAAGSYLLMNARPDIGGVLSLYRLQAGSTIIQAFPHSEPNGLQPSLITDIGGGYALFNGRNSTSSAYFGEGLYLADLANLTATLVHGGGPRAIRQAHNAPGEALVVVRMSFDAGTPGLCHNQTRLLRVTGSTRWVRTANGTVVTGSCSRGSGDWFEYELLGPAQSFSDLVSRRDPSGLTRLFHVPGSIAVSMHSIPSGSYAIPDNSTIFASEETATGTNLLANVAGGWSTVASLPAGGTFETFWNRAGTNYFRYTDAINGTELGESSGTVSGTALYDLSPGPSSSNPNDVLDVIVPLVGFRALITDDSHRLWVHDTHSGNLSQLLTGVTGMTRVSSTAVLLRGDTLGATNGFSSGTSWFATPSDPGGILALGTGEALLRGTTFAQGAELWRSDGTAAGTSLEFDIDTTPAATAPSDPSPGATRYGSKLFFTANDGVHGRELWSTDGTEIGTALVSDIRLGGGGSSPNELTSGPDCVFFTAATATNGRELWRTDGVATQLLKDVGSGVTSGDPRELTMVQNTLYFRAWSAGNGVELWKSDGTTGSTQLVTNIWPGGGSSNPTDLTAWGHRLAFAADDSASGRELCISDGTAAGTIVIDKLAGSAALDPQDFATYRNHIFFSADDGLHGRELWVSDGTPAGTVLLHDINPGIASSNPSDLVEHAGSLWMVANDPQRHLWRIEQQANGFVASRWHTNPIVGISDPRDLTPVDDLLLMSQVDPSDGLRKLYRTATIAGEDTLEPVLPGIAAPLDPTAFHALGGRIAFFDAFTNYSGAGLYASNGNSAWLVRSGDDAGVIGTAESNLLFAISQSDLDRELWSASPYATSHRFGRSCGGFAELHATDPILGETMRVHGRSTIGALQAGLFFALPPFFPVPLPGTTDCPLYIGVSHMGLPPVGVNPVNGEFFLDLPIHNDPGLTGLSFMFQAALIPGTGPFLGLDLTNGVLVFPAPN